MNRSFFIIFVSLLLPFVFLTPVSYASDCPVVIYGGGEIPCLTPTSMPNESASPTPTVAQKSTPTPTKAQAPTTAPTKTPTPTKKPAPQKATPTPAPKTKGGLPVHEPTKAKTTPATGPEALSLLGLIPTAGLGFWLRRKTQGK